MAALPCLIKHHQWLHTQVYCYKFHNFEITLMFCQLLRTLLTLAFSGADVYILIVH